MLSNSIPFGRGNCPTFHCPLLRILKKLENKCHARLEIQKEPILSNITGTCFLFLWRSESACLPERENAMNSAAASSHPNQRKRPSALGGPPNPLLFLDGDPPNAMGRGEKAEQNRRQGWDIEGYLAWTFSEIQ